MERKEYDKARSSSDMHFRWFYYIGNLLYAMGMLSSSDWGGKAQIEGFRNRFNPDKNQTPPQPPAPAEASQQLSSYERTNCDPAKVAEHDGAKANERDDFRFADARGADLLPECSQLGASRNRGAIFYLHLYRHSE